MQCCQDPVISCFAVLFSMSKIRVALTSAGMEKVLVFCSLVWRIFFSVDERTFLFVFLSFFSSFFASELLRWSSFFPLVSEIACEKNRMQCCLQCWCGVRSVSNPRKNLVQDEHAISAVNV